MTPARWCARAGAREDAGMTSRRLALTESIRDRWFRALHAGRQPRIVRASLRFSVCWGGLGAGGVTFAAMISLTAGLTILVSLARAFLGDRPFGEDHVRVCGAASGGHGQCPVFR